mmetsp:Transcript_2850/g.8818  ORF Transcript_2850/g.8818 Transcript_2850/m.8818 type:complete len:284 (-) Transcript_2850:1332-2183(-)
MPGDCCVLRISGEFAQICRRRRVPSATRCRALSLILPPDRALDQVVVRVVQIGPLVHVDQVAHGHGPLLLRHAHQRRRLRPKHDRELAHAARDVPQGVQVHLDQELGVGLLPTPKRGRPLLRHILQHQWKLDLTWLFALAVGRPVHRPAVNIADADLLQILREAQPRDHLVHLVFPRLRVLDLEVLHLLDGVDAIEGAVGPLRIREQGIEGELRGAEAHVPEGADRLAQPAVAEHLGVRVLAKLLQHVQHRLPVHDNGSDGRGPEAGGWRVQVEGRRRPGVPL